MSEVPENRTDLGNARRLAKRNRHRLRFVHSWDKWLVFDGRRWLKDATGQVHRLAKETAKAIYAEALAAEDATERGELAKWAIATESERRLRSMVNVAASEADLVALPGEFDSAPWLLNVANGTIDLRTGDLREHSASDMLTKLVPVSYDPAAKAELFHEFLSRILPSEEMRGFLKRAVGYSLTGSTREQALFFLHGGGQNGKSTLLELLREMLGDCAVSADFTTFTVRRSEGPRNDVARLHTARFVTAVEVSEGKHLDEALVKSLTGAETIAARLLYRETFEFRPQFKIWLAANYRPEIRGRDHAIWRRVHLLPFSVQIPDSEKDADLPTKLRAELPGVLAWAVEGCLEWQRDGLNPPAEVHEATQSYKAEMDTMGAFLGDRCIEVLGASGQASPLYRAYCEWAAANNEPLLSSTKFGREMTNRFAKVKDARGLIRYAGIMLRNDGSEALGGFEEANSNSLHEGVIRESSRNGH